MLNIQETQQDNNLFFIEKRFEVMLDMNNKKLIKEISELKDGMRKLEEEIKGLKSAQKVVQSVQSNNVNSNAQIAPSISNERKSPNNSASNEINPQEISIQKYFYFGKK